MSFNSADLTRKSDLKSSMDDFILIQCDQENINPNGKITDVAQKQLSNVNDSTQNKLQIEEKRTVHEMSAQEEDKLATVFDGLFEQKELRTQYATIFKSLPRNQRLRNQKVKHLAGIRTAIDPEAYVNKHFTSKAAQYILAVSREKPGNLKQNIYNTLFSMQIDTINIGELAIEEMKLNPIEKKLAKTCSQPYESRSVLVSRYSKIFNKVPSNECPRFQKIVHLKGIRTAADPVAYVNQNFKPEAAEYILRASLNKKGNLNNNIWETLLGLPIEMTNIEVLFDQYPSKEKVEQLKKQAFEQKCQAYGLVFKQQVDGNSDESQVKNGIIEKISKLDGTELEEQIDQLFYVFPAIYVHDQARRIFYRENNTLSLAECYIQAIQKLPISDLEGLKKILLPYQTYAVELLESPFKPIPFMIVSPKQVVSKEQVVEIQKTEDNILNPLLDNFEKVKSNVTEFISTNKQISVVKDKFSQITALVKDQF